MEKNELHNNTPQTRYNLPTPANPIFYITGKIEHLDPNTNNGTYIPASGAQIIISGAVNFSTSGSSFSFSCEVPRYETKFVNITITKSGYNKIELNRRLDGSSAESNNIVNIDYDIVLTKTGTSGSGSGDHESDTNIIKSPIIGTYYSSRDPYGAPFVSVGKSVNQGDVVCIIEAMKLFNEIKAHKAGVITKILVNSGEYVWMDQPLMEIE